MKEFVHQAWRTGSALAAAAIVLGIVADAHGYQQRRGRMYIPQPTPVDSSPMIDGLNKALKALDETDRDFDGHLEKAIKHIRAAMGDVALPNQRKGNAGKAQDKGGKTPQTDAEADASLGKALKALFSVHHKLADNASTKGRIHADAEVRIAIQELGYARKLVAPANANAKTTANAKATTPANAKATTPANAKTATPANAKTAASAK